MKFIISGRLPGLNEVIGASRYNRFAGAKQKREATDLCRFHIIAQNVQKISAPVMVHFTWYERDRRRDCDNVATGAKFILDALVEQKILPNDNRKWVRGISHLFPEPDPLKPRIEVTVTEITENG